MSGPLSKGAARGSAAIRVLGFASHDGRSRHGREVVLRRGAARDVAADDGLRNRGDRSRRSRGGQEPLRAREARIPVHARHAGGRDGRADLVRQGEAGGRRRARGVGVEPRAQLEAERREDRRSRSQGDRAGPGRHLARPFDRGGRPEPRCLRDRRGRREADLHDEPLRLRSAPVAQWALWPGWLGRHRLGPRLELRARGFPPLLHPLRLHERARADQLDRVPGLSLRSARGLRPRPLRLALVQGPRGHPGAPLEALRAGAKRCRASPVPRSRG